MVAVVGHPDSCAPSRPSDLIQASLECHYAALMRALEACVERGGEGLFLDNSNRNCRCVDSKRLWLRGIYQCC